MRGRVEQSRRPSPCGSVVACSSSRFLIGPLFSELPLRRVPPNLNPNSVWHTWPYQLDLLLKLALTELRTLVAGYNGPRYH